MIWKKFIIQEKNNVHTFWTEIKNDSENLLSTFWLLL